MSVINLEPIFEVGDFKITIIQIILFQLMILFANSIFARVMRNKLRDRQVMLAKRINSLVFYLSEIHKDDFIEKYLDGIVKQNVEKE